ncbi:MAG: hypothetical protein PHQ11_01255 [Paludibacter sp.]|nr:hypothetical protein [Paludibacter sp.]MDD4198331.1 hypothetical protein [Paludibacter sp.]MDD4428072.1 hypothetical protein [Paludibacter sp.]
MNLKTKVLEFINEHSDGVKISDMEKPLGERRMKLGYVTKNLLDEGKIQKVDDCYFPVYDSKYNNLKFFRNQDF